MSMARKCMRNQLRNRLRDMGIQKPNKRMSKFWKEFKKDGKI